MQDEETTVQDTVDPAASGDVESAAMTGRFFKWEDWIAALATFLFSGWVFFRNMAPEVTLQDSGELVTGAFTFGVPHPPGYPIWAFLGYVWSRFIVPFGNPAWRIGTMSVFTGALTVGLMTLIMTRSTRILLHAMPRPKAIDEQAVHWIALAVGVSIALLFGFNRAVWLWSGVSEMRVLNVFSFILIGFTFFVWLIRPEKKMYLYATLLAYGLSMTNHQTVAVIIFAVIVGTLAQGADVYFQRKEQAPQGKAKASEWRLVMSSIGTFWDVLVALLFSLAVVMAFFAWLPVKNPGSYTNGVLASAGLGAALLAVGVACKWVRPKYVLLFVGLFMVGCMFYLYMPFASATNPPMNWATPFSKEGFLHAVTRGQYQAVKMASPLNVRLLTQIKIHILLLLSNQYSWQLCLFAFVSLAAPVVWLYRNLTRDFEKHKWLLYVWCGAFLMSLLFVMGIHGIAQSSPEYSNASTLGQMVALLLGWGVFLATLLCLLIGLWSCLRRPGGSLAVFIWASFLVTSFGLIMIINPPIDRQEQEINSKFFAPTNGFYAMLIGYGIAMCIVFAAYAWERWLKEVAPLRPWVIKVACVALLALPSVTYTRNWKLCALSTHDFGYQFGYRMFCPGGGYEDMTKDAVLFGGTDPGRFVPTYMIFCESRVKPADRYQSKWMKASDPSYDGSTFDRSDVYIITQNALADQTYMSYIRDHYDYSRPDPANTNTLAKFMPWQRRVFTWAWTALDRQNDFPKTPIRIPTPEDSQRAFQQFVQDVEAGRVPPNAEITIDNGRVQVKGALGVMEINGILAKWIFDWNKDKHDFYVEESYVIRWMYPYLRPAGVIMKIEKEPLPSPQQDPALWAGIVAKDKAYWDQLSGDLLAREEFCRSLDAKKSFSKMRSAIAGLYLSRGMHREAEYAFRQAVDLCPESPEGSFRLAELYLNQRRFKEARQLIAAYMLIDKYNPSAKGFFEQIDRFAQNDVRRAELTEKIQKAQDEGGVDFNDAFALLEIYAQMNMHGDLHSLGRSLLANTNAPPQYTLRLGTLFSDVKQTDLASEALARYTAHVPQDPRGWIEIGWVHLVQGRSKEAYEAWVKAVRLGGDDARVALRDDPRFLPLWQQKDPNLKPFLDLLPPARSRNAPRQRP